MNFENVSYSRKVNMSHIRDKDTHCEIVLRHALWKRGYRYRKNYCILPGKPDICLTKYKVAIFCDSDYFHGKDWESKLQKQVAKGNNSKYWLEKIKGNIERDNKVDAQLRGMGWTVMHFWSSNIEKNSQKCIDEIEDMVKVISEE